MTDSLTHRIFSLDDQQAFARLSSDSNPMHLDPNFARRTQVGAPVVHGIHTLIWAADAVLRAYPMRVLNITARFPQPLYLDEIASVRLKSRTDRQVDIEVVATESVVALIKLSTQWGRTDLTPRQPTQATPDPISQAANPAFEELSALAGTAVVPGSDILSLFPALARAVGEAGVKALLATSQIVGMRCPGLHSLFAELSINFNSETETEPCMGFAVSNADPRFRSLKIDVWGYGVTGKLDAFARLPPPPQAGIAEVAARVIGRPFNGHRSLIVGGSRGLGEVTAKIVAAGGGTPVITYRNNRDEAERVATEIRSSGGHCDILQYDATRSAEEQLRNARTTDSCYYFATPKIFQRKSALYEPDKLRTFLDYYADGFFDLCKALVRDRTTKLAMFYPSTVAVDGALSTTAEYAMAKSAGETLVHHLNEFMPNIEILCRRLPRILTDQTATVGVASADNALNVMLPITHEVQLLAGRSRDTAGPSRPINPDPVD